MQEDWKPGIVKTQSEFKPQPSDRTVDRTKQLLVQRVGQLRPLNHVVGDSSPNKQPINDQLKRKLRTNCRCD